VHVGYSGVIIPSQILEADEKDTAHQCDLFGSRSFRQASVQGSDRFIVLLESKISATIHTMISLARTERFPPSSLDLLMHRSNSHHGMLDCGLGIAHLEKEAIPEI
jgi:hypothetical protein